MKHVLLVLVLLSSVPAFAQDSPDEAALRNAEMARYASLREPSSPMTVASDWFDVTYYGIHLQVMTGPNHLYGTVVIRGVVRTDSATALTLDLADTMNIFAVTQGSPLFRPVVRLPGSFIVTLNRTYYRDEIVQLEVTYDGLPLSTGFGSFEFSVHAGVPWIWSLSEPYGAKDWWPCKDNPADKADSVDMYVQCDSSFKVGSNGRLVSVTNNGDGTKTHHWHEGHPIATYLVSVAMTNFAEFSNWFVYSPTDSMQILNYVLPEHLSSALATMPKTVDMLRIFSSLYGLYPFIDEKYGHSEFGKGGGMEHQTMTSLTSPSFSESVISHELGHQWFGDLVTCRNWAHLWLNEGFAQYSTAVYYEQEYGVPNYWGYMNTQLNIAKAATGTLVLQDTSTISSLFNSLRVYSKGSVVLHMLRHILGDSVFFHALRNYAHDPALTYGSATTDDFQASCEATSGTPLGYFFSEWAYGEKYPVYSYSWNARDTLGGSFVEVTIDQATGTTNPSFFVMPMDIKVSGAGVDTLLRIFNDHQHQVASWIVPFTPTGVTLDPDNWILKTSQLVTSVEELGTSPRAFRLGQNYPNPFNGATRFAFDIPSRGRLTLTAWNVAGERVAQVVDREFDAGRWSASWDAGNLPSGVYLARAFFLPGSGATPIETVRKLLLLR